MSRRSESIVADIVQAGRERLDAGDDFVQVHKDMDKEIRVAARAEHERVQRIVRRR